MPSEDENLILIKRSSVSGVVPKLSSLEIGELGLNTADGKIFLKTETETLTSIKTFLNSDDQYFVFNKELSAVKPLFGGNTVTQVFGSVLGGYNNDNSGAGSTVVNGENNDIDGDFALIGNGLNNKITVDGDYSFIGGGQNNLIQHQNVFTFGSNLTSHSANFTYVNNISATGKLYGDASELTGIVAGDTEATTLVRSNSGEWDGVYTTVISNSANWNNPQIDVVLTSNPIKFVFTGDGSTTSYAVSGTAGSTNASLIEVFVDNVRQEPTFSYTLSSEIINFTEAPSLSSRIVIITPNTVAGQLSVAKRHDFIDENTYSISYAAIAPYGTPDSGTLWRITKIIYTDTGTISATQYAENVAWSDRLILSYN
jgi:hypothetical protein